MNNDSDERCLRPALLDPTPPTKPVVIFDVRERGTRCIESNCFEREVIVEFHTCNSDCSARERVVGVTRTHHDVRARGINLVDGRGAPCGLRRSTVCHWPGSSCAELHYGAFQVSISLWRAAHCTHRSASRRCCSPLHHQSSQYPAHTPAAPGPLRPVDPQSAM